MTTEDMLFELEQELVKRGYPKMDAPTLKETYARMQNQTFQQMMTSGQMTVKQLADEIDKGVGAVKERKAKRQAPQTPPMPSMPSQMMPQAPGMPMRPQMGMN